MTILGIASVAITEVSGDRTGAQGPARPGRDGAGGHGYTHRGMAIFRSGDRVYDRRFGRGGVTSIIGFGESVQLRIRFDSGEEHDVLARSLDLELLTRATPPAEGAGESDDEPDASGGHPGETALRPSHLPPETPRAETLARAGFLPPRTNPPPSAGGPASPGVPRRVPLPVDPVLRDALAQLAADLIGAAGIPEMDRWMGGELIVRPGREGTKEKVVPLDAFFHKIVMVRDRLRTLEQKINSSPTLSDAEKVEMQQYLTRAAGSLTTFNFLFRDREDWFVGQSGAE